MGICESTRNIKTPKEDNKPTEYNIINEVIVNNVTKMHDNITKKVSTFEEIDRQITKVSKSICKIEIETQLNTKKGTGFLIKFRIEQEDFYCLLSNQHVITMI